MTSASAQNHIRIVSLLTLAGGVLGLLPSLVMLLVAGGLLTAGPFGTNPGELFLAGGIVGLIALCFLVIGLPAVIAGFGLLARKGWARPLTLVIAVFNLLAFPLGTVLGIYQFWVLAMNEETVAAYKYGADVPARDYA
jgi:hypothetical protein